MGITKIEIHSPQILSESRALTAIAHPVRLTIMKYLRQHETATVGQLTEHLTLAQSTVSMHLDVLKGHEMISGTPVGPAVYYSLNEHAMDQVRIILIELAEEL